MAKIAGKAAGKTIRKVAGQVGREVIKLNPLEVLHEYFDYKKTIEQHESYRQTIEAKRDIVLTTLEYQREIILTYFEKRFSERREALGKLFTLLSSATDSKDDKQLDVALAGIMGILKENPLGDFESFKKHMLESDYEVEL